MAEPHVSILLLNWNNSKDTIECLESVFALDYGRLDVVLCDNASTDGSPERIRAWVADRLAARTQAAGSGARGAIVEHDRARAEGGGSAADAAAAFVLIHTGGNLGFAGGNNVGLRYVLARGDAEYVWLLNNDCVVAPDVLRQLVAEADATAAVGAVGATLLEYYRPDTVQDVAGGIISPWHGMMARIGHGRPASSPRPRPDRLDYISGGCMLVPVPVLRRIGLLDERFFMYGEDADWCTRMRAEGFALAYAPHADVWHKGAASAIPRSPGHEFHTVVSPLLLVSKHRPARLPIAFLYSLYRCLLPKIVRLQRARLLAVLRAYRHIATRLVRAVTPALTIGSDVGAAQRHRVIAEPSRKS